MPDDLTGGEIRRWLERIERRQGDDAREMLSATQYEIAHKALIERVAEVEKDQAAEFARLDADMKAGFERVERASQERKGVLERKDAELETAVQGLRAELAKKAERRTEWSRQVKIAVFTVGGALMAALLGAWITAILTAKGIK